MTLCNWVGVIVQGYINFVVPALIYRSSLLRYPDIPQSKLSLNHVDVSDAEFKARAG